MRTDPADCNPAKVWMCLLAACDWPQARFMDCRLLQAKETCKQM
jgi:hypothetical protein